MQQENLVNFKIPSNPRFKDGEALQRYFRYVRP